jgi:hypothetical protein
MKKYYATEGIPRMTSTNILEFEFCSFILKDVERRDQSKIYYNSILMHNPNKYITILERCIKERKLS